MANGNNDFYRLIPKLRLPDPPDGYEKHKRKRKRTRHQLQIALDGELEIGFIVRIDQNEGIFADELGELLYGPSPNTLIEGRGC